MDQSLHRNVVLQIYCKTALQKVVSINIPASSIHESISDVVFCISSGKSQAASLWWRQTGFQDSWKQEGLNFGAVKTLFWIRGISL